jgi:2-polyprenyl-6-methoxyphenol hydroxylase-like FAD-dependent oxidoreductase
LSRPLKIQVIERARALIADEQHWCRRHLAQDGSGVAVSPTSVSAVKRCGLGAVIAAAYEITGDHLAAHDLAIRVMRPLYSAATLVKVNDIRGHAAVLALFEAIAVGR